ncbi:isoaspartyl peptidase/L-asparaginase family protein [Altererythrobacter sp. MF3-039]|uniref:isoaspartyl peptidase/L-asparaginase family protein n=1 Tax=Altererythrobacter sp. MF3-039 TaxID=3252901 RepID=UPI00390C55AC
MIKITKFLAALIGLLSSQALVAHKTDDSTGWSIAIHGGAGTIERDRMTPGQQAEYETALAAALEAGAKVLREGGSAIDAVKAAIMPMEDDPNFNAGRGAVFTWEEHIEHDVSIMDGRDRSAGAASGLRLVKNPILLADAIRVDGRHVFLSGEGAQQFASERDFELVAPEWFETERRRESLERLKTEKVSALDVDHKFGTVGAVARDSEGNLAAGTSTGGMTGKRWGRIGDTPVIGAGTYADNRSCAVSATGWGEYFIRVGVAQEICTRVRLSGNPDYQSAADEVMAEVAELGGDGGVIVMPSSGEPIFSFNTSGMYRARVTADSAVEVGIFGD